MQTDALAEKPSEYKGNYILSNVYSLDVAVAIFEVISKMSIVLGRDHPKLFLVLSSVLHQNLMKTNL